MTIYDMPGVGQETRERIQALLKQYHYNLDENARGLSTKSSRTIGILMTFIPGLHTEHAIEGLFYMEGELAKHGYHCLLINTGITDEEVVASVRSVAGKRVDGVIFAGAFYAKPVVQKAIEQYLAGPPVVMSKGVLKVPSVSGRGIMEAPGLEED